MKYYKEKLHIAIEYIETRYIIRKYWNFMVPQKTPFERSERVFFIPMGKPIELEPV